MFNRYSERARRALFFARLEVSEQGAEAIGTEHLLLGVLREPEGLLGRILTAAQIETIRRDVWQRVTARPKTPESMEVPFGPDAEHALQFAAEEADGLGHSYIGTEHLILGLVRAKGSLAGSILTAHGLTLEGVRGEIVTLLRSIPLAPPVAARADAAAEIDRLILFAGQLAEMSPAESVASQLASRITDGLERLRLYVASRP